MEIVLIITIYMVGCVLTFGRFTASFYEIDEEFIENLSINEWWNCKYIRYLGFFLVILSWIGFLGGVVVYFGESEKYFLKFSYKGLIND